MHLPLTFENRSPISNIHTGSAEEYPIREQQIEWEKHLIALMSEVCPDRSLSNIISGHITELLAEQTGGHFEDLP